MSKYDHAWSGSAEEDAAKDYQQVQMREKSQRTAIWYKRNGARVLRVPLARYLLKQDYLLVKWLSQHIPARARRPVLYHLDLVTMAMLICCLYHISQAGGRRGFVPGEKSLCWFLLALKHMAAAVCLISMFPLRQILPAPLPTMVCICECWWLQPGKFHRCLWRVCGDMQGAISLCKSCKYKQLSLLLVCCVGKATELS